MSDEDDLKKYYENLEDWALGPDFFLFAADHEDKSDKETQRLWDKMYKEYEAFKKAKNQRSSE
jgi:hypothetical protein